MVLHPGNREINKSQMISSREDREEINRAVRVRVETSHGIQISRAIRISGILTSEEAEIRGIRIQTKTNRHNRNENYSDRFFAGCFFLGL